MKVQILWLVRRLNANYWFYPALFSVGALGLAIATVAADRIGWSSFLEHWGWIGSARPDGASDMLQVIAGSMIAVASTVFSITIVAVSYASGTYGPRLLTNFMEDKGNQLSLATFIGTFVFALTVLGSVRSANESADPGAALAEHVGAVDTALQMPGFVPQLSLLVAFGLMALSIAVLVFFLNHIPSSIRINRVIEGIGSRLIEAITNTYPERGADDVAITCPGGTQVLAQKAGYVQLIDFASLVEIARKHDCDLTLSVRTGDFLHEGLPMLEISGAGTDEAGPDEYMRQQMRDCFTQGFARTPEQDPQFLIDELVEIGLRALSPGINDPFTAITALHWLGAATAQLGGRELVRKLSDGEADACPVHPLPDDFSHFLNRGFGTMRAAVATSPIAAKIMLEVLANIASTLRGEKRRGYVHEEAAQLLEQARLALDGPDLRGVEEKFSELACVFRQS